MAKHSQTGWQAWGQNAKAASDLSQTSHTLSSLAIHYS
jgi:hypothetical protein